MVDEDIYSSCQLFVFYSTINSISANSIGYEHEYRSFSSVDLKIEKETSSNTIENDLENCCKNEWDLVVYRNRGAGIEAIAAKGGNYLYHYTTGEAAESIMKTGLTVTERRPFIYTTNVGNLSPLRANWWLERGTKGYLQVEQKGTVRVPNVTFIMGAGLMIRRMIMIIR